ncbi:hypothetical protein CYMTET_28650 [Cymbomonas tetramitiformis]|uniref:Uncharacterized protein n=1 Tax=Cymbomonas tetramitiformis TaxID=36881 RepID=A0AAE0FMQ0_9CHLO|nr:hypothetical protein CYMTET_28650 [Cymbomonas tetramitiformis]
MPVNMMKRRRPAKPPVAQQSGCLCVYLLLVSALGVTVCLWSLYSVAHPSSHTPELQTPSAEGDGKQDPLETVVATSSEEQEWKQLEQDHLKGELLEAKEGGLDDVPAKVDVGSQTMYEKCRGRIHVIFSTVCNPYGDWQSEGLVYSHFKVGMRGTISRITSCNDEKYKYPKVWHPCYNVHVTKDLTGKVLRPFEPYSAERPA